MRAEETDVVFFFPKERPTSTEAQLHCSCRRFVCSHRAKENVFPSCQLFSQLIQNCSPFYDIPRCFVCVEDCVTTIHARTWNLRTRFQDFINYMAK